MTLTCATIHLVESRFSILRFVGCEEKYCANFFFHVPDPFDIFTVIGPFTSIAIHERRYLNFTKIFHSSFRPIDFTP